MFKEIIEDLIKSDNLSKPDWIELTFIANKEIKGWEKFKKMINKKLLESK